MVLVLAAVAAVTVAGSVYWFFALRKKRRENEAEVEREVIRIEQNQDLKSESDQMI